jgi:hypothetical protein
VSFSPKNDLTIIDHRTALFPNKDIRSKKTLLLLLFIISSSAGWAMNEDRKDPDL